MIILAFIYYLALRLGPLVLILEGICINQGIVVEGCIPSVLQFGQKTVEASLMKE